MNWIEREPGFWEMEVPKDSVIRVTVQKHHERKYFIGNVYFRSGNVYTKIIEPREDIETCHAGLNSFLGILGSHLTELLTNKPA